jgi:membrane dipeptidase
VSVSEIVAHISHVIRLAGIDHVGLGSDFDGVGDNLPIGMEDVSRYPNLIRELLKAGFSEEDIGKICSGNLLRVWREVEEVAAGG